jgi:hypothetical protein
MKTTRIAAILLFAFLLGGSSAELAVRTKHVIDQRLHHLASAQDGSAGELVAFEIQRETGEVLARPRVIASPGRVAELVLRDPEAPDRIRLALRVETVRESSGHLSIDYLLSMPNEELVCRGRVRMTPGVERRVGLGGPIVATLFTVPVPSAAFDAFLQSERAARKAVKPI